MRRIFVIMSLALYSLFLQSQDLHPDFVIDSLSQQLDNVPDTTKIDIFIELSEIYWGRSFDTSLLFATHALNLSREVEDQERIGISLNMTGNAYYMLSNYSEGLNYYLQALQIREEIGDSNEIAKTYNNIGAVHLELKDYQQALDYFTMALSFYKGLDNDEVVWSLINNIGAVYDERKEYEKAYEYFLESYAIVQDLDDIPKMLITLNNLGEVAGSMGSYDEALEYFEDARTKSKAVGDIRLLATILVNMGSIQMSLGLNNNAFENFNKALLYAEELNSLQIKRDVYDNLHQYYEQRNEYRKALDYMHLYTQANDSILSEENRMKVAKLEIENKARNFQNEIEILKRDNEITKLRVTRQRFIILSLGLVILLVGGMLFTYVRRIRFRRETNELLTQKNNELETTNIKLQESEKNLKELNATKDKFFSIIGHDLRNPLNALLGFSELISGNSKEYSLDEIQKYNKIINEAARNIHQLIENLLEWSRSQSGNIEFSPKTFNLNEVVSEIQNVMSISADKKEINIINEIPDDLKIYADKNLLSTILRNLVNNAVKFTPEKGFITLSAKKENKSTLVSVTDTGIGMNSNQLENLFQLNTNVTTSGTSEEKGTGLGLILCKEFIEMHKGTIQVISESQNGSSFIFTLPDEN